MKIKNVFKKLCNFLCILFFIALFIGLAGNISSKFDKVYDLIKYIKENNCKVGIAVKPNTKVEEIFEFLPYIHMCLIMTVEPGKGGQTLITDMVEKIEKLKEYLDNNNIEIDIEADGGINLKTAPIIKEAGANVLVSGTAIVMAKDFKPIIEELKK